MIDFSPLAALPPLPASLPYRIFDAHTHTYPAPIAARATEALGHFYDFPVQGEGTYDDLAKCGRACGYDGFLLFCVATNAHQVQKVNDSIAALTARAKNEGFLAVGLAGMHQSYPDMIGELERCAELGLGGVKLHPDIQQVDVDDPVLLPLYERMEQMDQLLYLHAGDNRVQYRFSSPDKIARIASLFPHLRIVAAHLGGYRAWEEGKCLHRLDNLFTDCSSALWAMSPDRGAELIRAWGVDRVLYGSDYPVLTPEQHLRLFLTLPLTESERETVLYRSAASLLGLPR